jgi:hypothetical protein
MLAVERNRPTMLARIEPQRPHWGRRKLKRDQRQKTRLILLELRNIPQQERHNDERWGPS